MGKFEKLVVLTVLFAVAIVLAISFNRNKEAQASDPLSGAEQVLGQEAPPSEPLPELDPTTSVPPAADAAAAKDAQEKSLLLNAGPESLDQAAASSTSLTKLTAEPQSDPSRPILKESTALRPSFSDNYMVYIAAEGDTWASLAQRFYQDGRYTRNLLRANDEMPSPTAGTSILVPVFDEISAEAGLQPSAGLSQPTNGGASSTAPVSLLAADAAPQTSPVGGAPAGKLLEYEVQSGDTLSDISLAVFGTSTRWNEILDANKDKLAKPESLKVGMKLRIPEGGKLPVAGAKAPAKKVEPKPKTAQKSEPTTAAAPKKKKVL